MNLKTFAPRNLVHQSTVLLDRLRGLDFWSVIQPEEVGLDSKSAYRSEPSGNKYLTNLLRDFGISSRDSIIDIGCGKGCAMRTMLKFPFARVDGVELSDHIAAIAALNFKRLKADRSSIFACDASRFKDFDSYNMVYFYNPFPDHVMSDVMDALTQSLLGSERELVIIYNNATCHDIVVRKGVFSKVAVYPDEWGKGMSVYSNRAGCNSRVPAGRYAVSNCQTA